jgi:TolA-binding protein
MKRSLYISVLIMSLGYSYEVPIKDVVIQNRSKISYLKSKLAEQQNRIDGLISIIDGMNATIEQLKSNQRLASKSDDTALIRDLGKMIDKINANYVSKDELKKVLSKYNIKYSDEKKSSTPAKAISKSSTKELYSQAMKFYLEKEYAQAIKRFEICDKRGYKVAQSNFYLGEISYYTKAYDNALFYYKKSASISSSASYMPVLMLHTAISLDRVGQKSQAKLFYQNVIDNYPSTKSATIAQNRLGKL